MNSITIPKAVTNWLITGCVLIFCMVCIGGITRLTDSGLSITEWKLIMGTIPPLNDLEWQDTFEKYQQFPEFQLINQGMTLSEFKGIFFWEYLHRLWGRMMGLVFFFPFVWFWRKGYLKGKLFKQCLVILAGGAAIGGLGWFMVVSGLQDKPDVSHFRLAIHLMAAFLLLGYILNVIFGLKFPEKATLSYSPIRKISITFFVLLSIQIVYGAFVAGMDAGAIYNTYPLMNGEFMPENVTVYDSFIKNFTDHKDGVQFAHRNLALLVLVLGFFIAGKLNAEENDLMKKGAKILAFTLCLQFGLGVITLLLSKGNVPVWIGSLHQLGALLLFSASVFVLFLTKEKETIKN